MVTRKAEVQLVRRLVSSQHAPGLPTAPALGLAVGLGTLAA